MKKILCCIALVGVSVMGFAQNSNLFKAQDEVAKGNLNGALDLINQALAKPKTTKFADNPTRIYVAKARILPNTCISSFNTWLGKSMHKR